MFWSPQYWPLQLIAVAASLALLACTELVPRTTRALYALLFAWASATNWRTALGTPDVYLEYADLAVLGLYREFIRGWFAAHILAIVGTIATCQGMIAVGLAIGDRFARVALIGATLFLLMIVPLGAGSGFPSTLLLAAGCVRLLRAKAVLAHPLLARRASRVGGPTA